VANLVINESAHTQLDVSYWFTTHHKDYKINFGFEAERWPTGMTASKMMAFSCSTLWAGPSGANGTTTPSMLG